MWNPTCYGNPGKVSDAQYTCSTGDGGGVHSNSGVPNHAYALLVDGGTYNGQTIAAIGLTKAAHIYFRAQSVYQGPASDFADHADALEQSCSDLIGVEPGRPLDRRALGPGDQRFRLRPGREGRPGGRAADTADAVQLPAAAGQDSAAAVRRGRLRHAALPRQLRQRQLVGRPLDRRATRRSPPTSRRATGRSCPVCRTTAPGSAFFGIDFPGGTCAPGGDESGVLHLVSPQITIPASVARPRLTFDHWVATEAGWDGGNLKISVNGGPWQLVQAADFVYNPYNTTLVDRRPAATPTRSRASPRSRAPTAAPSTARGDARSSTSPRTRSRRTRSGSGSTSGRTVAAAPSAGTSTT